MLYTITQLKELALIHSSSAALMVCLEDMAAEKDSSSYVLPLGKYKGLTLDDAMALDMSYFLWLVEQDWLKDPLLGHVQAAILAAEAPVTPPPQKRQRHASPPHAPRKNH